MRQHIEPLCDGGDSSNSSSSSYPSPRRKHACTIWLNTLPVVCRCVKPLSIIFHSPIANCDALALYAKQLTNIIQRGERNDRKDVSMSLPYAKL